MKRGSAARGVDGFSLMEALAAIALTAAIVTSLIAVAGQWLPNWSRGFVGLQRADLATTGVERLLRDVAAAGYVSVSADARGPLFEGDEASLTFVRSAIGPNAYPHLEAVRYAEAGDPRGLAMTRTQASFAPVAAGRAAAFQFGDPVAIVRAPLHVSFAYAGADRVWRKSWTAQDRLPEAVRVTIRSDGAAAARPFSTAVAIRATAPAVPKPEAEPGQAPAAAAPAGGKP